MEVRKEAFNARKSRATSTEENEDEEDADEPSSISEGTLPALVEEWESWYPQEWVGWIMYGVPSENPTDHWVHQPTSEGPTDSEHFFTDEKGKRVSKKPAGRSHQRDVESVATAVTKISADSNTMMSHRLLQVDQELQIASSSHNLRIIQLLQSNATSEEEKSLVDDYYKEFLLHEGDLLRKRLAANKAQREQSSNASKPSQANNISTPIVAATTLSVKPTDSNLNANHHDSDEFENFGESFLALDSFESELT